MKKNRFLWALLLLVSLGAAAQDNIHFVAGTPTQKGLSQKNMEHLKLKVEQIIAAIMPELLHFTMRSSFSLNLFSERRRRRKDYCGT